QIPGGGGLPGAAGGAAEGAAAAGGMGLAAAAVALLGTPAVEIAIAGVAGAWLKANVPGWGTKGGAAQLGPVVIGGQSEAQAARERADLAKATASGGAGILDKGDREAFKQATLGIGKAADDMLTVAQ